MLGERIKALRIKNNMTQKELASKLNVIDKTISRWECNTTLPDVTIPIHFISAINNLIISIYIFSY